MFPRYAPRQLKKGLTPAVVASFALLTDRTRATPAIQQSGKAFLDAVARILSLIPVQDSDLRGMFRDHQALGSYVVARWAALAEPEEGLLQGNAPARHGGAAAAPRQRESPALCTSGSARR